MAAKETPNLIDSLEHNQLAQCELIDRCIDVCLVYSLDWF